MSLGLRQREALNVSIRLVLLAAALWLAAACALRAPGEEPLSAARLEASTPAAQAPGKPAGGLLKQPPATMTQPTGDLTQLSTAEQLDLVVPPTRDLRDLALRLNPEVGNIPLVVGDGTPDYAVGDTLEFWVHDLEANRNFRITAELIHKTGVAYAWVEQGKPADRDQIIQAIDRFSRDSYPAVRAFFGSEWNPGVDNDPRLHVLHATGLGDGIAGYYSSADQYSRLARAFSNEKEMFYINLSWLNRSQNYLYYETVLAHEFQHMILWYRDRNEETWINEGQSEFAQVVAGYEPSTLFADVFAANPDTQLTAWGETQGNNGPHYGSAFLFVSYFAQRFGADLTRALVAHPANGLRGVDAVLAAAGRPLSADQLFADWVVANYVDDPSALGQEGVYGYLDFDPKPPTPAARYDEYPTEAEAATVYNYAADYLLLEGRGDVRLHFRGATATRLADLQPRSGRLMWWGNRGDDFDTRLTRRFDLSDLPADTPVEMSAALWYDIEDRYDYGYVMASRDGAHWTLLSGDRMAPFEAEGSALGPGYTGRSDGWVTDHFDLSDYVGGEVWVRFEYVTDDAVGASGWFVDDITLPALGYAADFEQGADGWQSEGWLLTDNHLEQGWLLQLLTLEDGRLVGVDRFTVDSHGQTTIPAQLGGRRSAVVAVSALAPMTTEPADYEYWIDTN